MSACRWSALVLAIGAPGCSDPAPPDPEVASIELSVPDTGARIRFRDPLIVRATPQAALGVPLVRTVSWTSVTPSILAVQPLGANGDSARITAHGAGTGQVRVSAGSITRTFPVTVRDTVFSVTVTPGPLTLVAGDTVSYRAQVNGPPNAETAVRWDLTNAAIFEALTSPDPMVFRVQVKAAGTGGVRAMSLADTTKTITSAVTSQVGKLAFVVQPAQASREIPFANPPRVEVQDVTGQRSARAANTITLSITPGSCAGAAIAHASIDAASGTAIFPGATISARCASATLSASATPTAASAISQPFSVGPRGCGDASPFTTADTISAHMESTDCIVTRGGRQFLAHTYVLTVPPSLAGVGFNLRTSSSSFAPRVESFLWQDDPSVAWVDSITVPGGVNATYRLPAGTHRFVVTSPSPNGVGAYSTYVTDVEGPGPEQPWAECMVVTTPGITISTFLTDGYCLQPFSSRGGTSTGRLFLFYLRAGKAVVVTDRPFGTALDNDAYLESFDATASLRNPTFLDADDNSGGGVNGKDAMLTIKPAPTGRFILIRAGRVAGGGTSSFTLTISP